jgi:hypothetical protein
VSLYFYVLNSDGRIRQRLSRRPSPRQAALLTVVEDARKLEPGDWRYDGTEFIRYRRRQSDTPDRSEARDEAERRHLLKHHIGLIEDPNARRAMALLARSLGLIEEG